MRISRQEARRRIANATIGQMTEANRAAIVSEWWTLDSGDKAWSELSPALQRELETQSEAPSNASHQRYDPLIRIGLMDESIGVQNSWLEKKLREIGDTVQVIGEPESMVECRCCGHLSLHERGSYEVCPVCFWEDDGLQDLERMSGPNHMTLRDGKENFNRIGACSEDSLRHVAPDAHEKYLRVK